MTRVIILRHGETEWNAVNREQGHLDSPLTTKGIEQAEQVARRLSSAGASALYTSDLGRAEHTARIIGGATGLSLRRDPRLRERHMGIFQGLTITESDHQYAQERAAYRADDTYVIPGGESGVQRADRAFACLEELATRHPDETLIIVTHGGLLMGIVERTLGLPAGAGRRFRKRNTAINVFSRDPSGWRLESWGDAAHLEEIVTPPPAT